MLWDIATGRALLLMRNSGGIDHWSGLRFTPDGSRLIACAQSLMVWEASTGNLLMELRTGTGNTNGQKKKGLLGLGGGKKDTPFESVDDDVFEDEGASFLAPKPKKDKAKSKVGRPEPYQMTALALDNEGNRAAVGLGNGASQVWDINTGKLLMTLTARSAVPVSALEFNWPDNEDLNVAQGLPEDEVEEDEEDEDEETPEMALLRVGGYAVIPEGFDADGRRKSKRRDNPNSVRAQRAMGLTTAFIADGEGEAMQHLLQHVLALHKMGILHPPCTSCGRRVVVCCYAYHVHGMSTGCHAMVQ